MRQTMMQVEDFMRLAASNDSNGDGANIFGMQAAYKFLPVKWRSRRQEHEEGREETSLAVRTKNKVVFP